MNIGFVANVVELSTDLHYSQMSNNNLPGATDTLDWLEDLKHILISNGNVSKTILLLEISFLILIKCLYFNILEL